MSAVRLYSEMRELWALVSTGAPAHLGLLGAWRGVIVQEPNGGHRLRRRARAGKPAIDVAVEVGRYQLVVEAFVDEGGRSPRIGFRRFWVPESGT